MGQTVKVIEKDLGLKKIVRETLKLNKASTEVGIFGNSGGADTNLAARAAVQEFGNPRWKDSSGRPFMGQAFDNNLKDLEKAVKIGYGKVVDRKLTSKKFLQRVGEFHTGNIKDEITAGDFRALKPSTIAAKGSSKPLIDTGQMRNSVTHKEKM